VILRVFKGTVAPGQRDRVIAHLRDEIYPSAARVSGLRSFQAGFRELDAGDVEFAIVTTWDAFDQVVLALGPDQSRPRWMDAVEDAYRSGGAEHYELVGEQVDGLFPLEDAVLRIFQGTLRPRAGETFFDVARRRQTGLLDAGVIAASHMGRRVVGPSDEVVHVVLWHDRTAWAEEGAWAEFFSTSRVDAYDAVTRTAPRTGSEPALLLADDERRYLFATTAAAELIGRPVGRILGERIDDLVPPDLRASIGELWDAFLVQGAQSGPFRLEGRDGQAREFHFAARANTPWPGCHTSLIVGPGSAVGAEDIDVALADAGIVARYPVMVG